jgi:hypothetical protein
MVKGSELRPIPARPGTIQEMVETDARNRIRLLLQGACQRPHTSNKVYNKRRLKGLLANETRKRMPSVFGGGIWPSHRWDELLARGSCCLTAPCRTNNMNILQAMKIQAMKT